MDFVQSGFCETRASVAVEVIKWSTLVLVILLGRFQLIVTVRRPSQLKLYWTMLDLSHMILAVTSISLASFRVSAILSQRSSPEYLEITILRKASADIAMATSLTFLLAITCYRHRMRMNPHGYVAGLLGMLATATITETVSLYELLYSTEIVPCNAGDLQTEVCLCNVLLCVVLTGHFMSAGLRDNVCSKQDSSDKQKYVAFFNEDHRSLFGTIFCVAAYPILKSAVKFSYVAESIFPKLRRTCRSREMVEEFETLWYKKRECDRSSFTAAFFRVLWFDIFGVSMATLAFFACIICRGPILGWLMENCGTAHLSTSAVLFMATVLGDFFLSGHQLERTTNFAARVRTLMMTLAFKKMTKLSSTSRLAYPSGNVVALVGVDSLQTSIFAYQFAIPTCGIICLPAILGIIASRTGAEPAIFCAAYLLFLLSLPRLVSRLHKTLLARYINARNLRLTFISDLLSSVRLVKMYAWEKAYADKVQQIRELEIAHFFRLNILDGMLDSIFSASSPVLTIILFGSLALFQPGRVLTPALSFTCIYLISLTDLITIQASIVNRSKLQAERALTRLQKFFAEDEVADAKNCDQDIHDEQTGSILLNQCDFVWSTARDPNSNVNLENISLTVNPGSLVGLVGFVGSGKSSLLSAILGDMHCLKGKMACRGRVAHVPQLANVYNMSVRDNILFGRTMDSAFYHRVVCCSQLLNDFNKFPNSDLTEVGEKGTTLSGGQKQRVSLARAVYSQSDVYLLDDPMSALDPVVANNVFEKVIGKDGLLKKKTRIVVCNQPQYLRHMDKIILVHEGKLAVYDNLSDLQKDPKSPKTLFQTHDSSLERNAEISENFELSEGGKLDGRVVQNETDDRSKNGWQLIVSILKLSGYWCVLAVTCMIASAAALAWQLLWIKQWTDAYIRGGEVNSTFWVGGLLAICVADVSFRVLGSFVMALGARRLSTSVHNLMLSRILSSPTAFFDATPRGRILNRLSVDIDFMDTRFYLTTKVCAQNTLYTISKVVVVGTQTPSVLIAAAGAALLLVSLLYAAMKASNCCRLREGVRVSRLVSHLTETVDSLSTIRAYGMVDRFCRHCFRLADACIQAQLTYGDCYRIVKMAAAACGATVVLAVLLLSVLSIPSGDSLSLSQIGLALSAASSVPVALMFVFAMMITCLQCLMSFERCLEYTELTPEIDVQVVTHHDRKQSNDVSKRHDGWPNEGKVEFVDYCASYRPGNLPDVLRSINFVVQPRQKVGVVGRTGAGKSSLLLALLRILRSSRGRILIDGVDIAQVPLQKLRSAITIIPQDPSLVRGTLRDNLDPTNSHTDEELWQALEEAHLHGTVSQDLKGLGLETGDGGTNLSVGERQLVCLARALLRRSKILVLDEATAQIDGDTDRLIQDTLQNRFTGCTVLAIAHRVQTVINYDKILVMEDGGVLEFGPVGDLLSQKESAFRRMANEAGVLQGERQPSGESQSTNL